MIELPARTSETHTKETHNSTWHLFRNHSLKAADGDASASESIRLLSDDSRGSISVRTYCSWQRCKEAAEMERQIGDFSPSYPLPVGIIYTLASHVTGQLCQGFLSSVWIHNSHATFILLLSLILSFLSQPLKICYHLSLFHLIFSSTLSTSFSG